MAKRKAAQTVDATTGKVAAGVQSEDGMGQLVRQKVKALKPVASVSTTAVKAALDDPLRAAWLTLSSADGASVLARLSAELRPRTELAGRLRRAHAASMRLTSAHEPPPSTDGLVVGLNALSAHMELGTLRLAVIAKDAWPSVCIQHLPLLAHLSTVQLCLVANAADALGAAIGAPRLDALGFCGGDVEPWQDQLVSFIGAKAPPIGQPAWYGALPALRRGAEHER
jgi:ribosomal protein L7Ae-like RNA K-turn-binding protein